LFNPLVKTHVCQRFNIVANVHVYKYLTCAVCCQLTNDLAPNLTHPMVASDCISPSLYHGNCVKGNQTFSFGHVLDSHVWLWCTATRGTSTWHTYLVQYLGCVRAV